MPPILPKQVTVNVITGDDQILIIQPFLIILLLMGPLKCLNAQRTHCKLNGTSLKTTFGGAVITGTDYFNKLSCQSLLVFGQFPYEPSFI